jgi:hypothetical protein
MKEVKPLSVDEIKKIFDLGLEIEGFLLSNTDVMGVKGVNIYVIYQNTFYCQNKIIDTWSYYPLLITRVIEAINREDSCFNIWFYSNGVEIWNNGEVVEEMYFETELWPQTIDDCKTSAIRKYLEFVG